MKKILLILLIICVDNSAQNEAGVKVRISKPGLIFGANLGVDLLAQKLNSLTIPDYSGSKSLMSYSVTNIKLVSFRKPIPNIVPIAGSGLSVSLSNFVIDLSINWKYKIGKGWFSLKDSGSGSIKSKSISLSTAVNIGRDNNGKPAASMQSCSCTITGFNIHINGGLVASIYNLMINMFENKIKIAIQNSICSNVKKVINEDGNNKLSTLKTDVKIDPKINLDYKLTDKPVFTSEYLETSHAGEFFSSTGIKYNQISPQMTINLDNSKMVSFALSERLFNSGAYVLQKLGRINKIFPINNKDIASFLNLDKYNNTKLQLKIEATEAPFVHISSSSFAINTTAKVQIQTIGEKIILDLRVSLLLDCDIYFEANRIKGRVNNIRHNIFIENGSSGNFSSKALDDLLEGIIRLSLPSLNERGAMGFPMPSLDHLVLVNPILIKENGYAKVGCDLKSQP